MIKPLGDAIAVDSALKEQINGFSIIDQVNERLRESNMLGQLTEMMEKGSLPSLNKLLIWLPGGHCLGLNDVNGEAEGGAEGEEEGDLHRVFIHLLGTSFPRLDTLELMNMSDRHLAPLARAMCQRGHEAAKVIELVLARQEDEHYGWHVEPRTMLERRQASMTSLLQAPCMSQLKILWLSSTGRVQGVVNYIKSVPTPSRLTQLYLSTVLHPEVEDGTELASTMAAGELR